MKRLLLLITLAVSICSTARLNAQNMEYTNMFPRGEEFKNPYFTGKVWLEMLSDRDGKFNCPIGNVTFEPGCRNNWHKHPGGQILLCISGKGYYCAVTHLTPYIGYSRALNALTCLNEVLPEK